jgi:hypothetical protein
VLLMHDGKRMQAWTCTADVGSMYQGQLQGGAPTFLDWQRCHHQVVVVRLVELALDEEEVGGQLHRPAQASWRWPDGPLALGVALCQQHCNNSAVTHEDKLCADG